MSDARRGDASSGRGREHAHSPVERAGRPEGREEADQEQARRDEAARTAEEEDGRIDEEARESFPASDPLSHTGITGEGRRER